MPMALRFGGGAVASSSSTPSAGSEVTARPSGSEIGITWVL